MSPATLRLPLAGAAIALSLCWPGPAQAQNPIELIAGWFAAPVCWPAAQAAGECARAQALLQGPLLHHALLGWLGAAVLLPLMVLFTRYFKVLPGQDWPRVLDSRRWWYAHLALGACGAACSVAAALLAIGWHSGDFHLRNAHEWAGASMLLLCVAVLLQSLTAGTRGGPARVSAGTLGPFHGVAGDHYDMTPRRRRFEWLHRQMGMLVVLTGLAAVCSGLLHAGAPRWMLLVTLVWWLLLLRLARRFEREGRNFDAYQAIWGPGLEHPGNRVGVAGSARRYTESEYEALYWAHGRERRRRTSSRAGARARAGGVDRHRSVPASPVHDPAGEAALSMNQSPDTLFAADEAQPDQPDRSGRADPADPVDIRSAPRGSGSALPLGLKMPPSANPGTPIIPPTVGAATPAAPAADRRAREHPDA